MLCHQCLLAAEAVCQRHVACLSDERHVAVTQPIVGCGWFTGGVERVLVDALACAGFGHGRSAGRHRPGAGPARQLPAGRIPGEGRNLTLPVTFFEVHGRQGLPFDIVTAQSACARVISGKHVVDLSLALRADITSSAGSCVCLLAQLWICKPEALQSQCCHKGAHVPNELGLAAHRHRGVSCSGCCFRQGA